MKTIIHWYSGELVIENSVPELEDKLRYQHRSLEKDDRTKRTKVSSESVNLFSVVKESPRTITTYQGLIDRVIGYCRKLDLPYSVLDKRIKLPPLQLQHVKGFYKNQYSLFLNFLKPGRSGILSAPTRYGKTIMIINTLRAYPGLKTAVVAPGDDLLAQLMKDIKEAIPDRDVSGIFSGCGKKRESPEITVVSMDSLEKLDHDSFRLVLVDEPHSISAPTRILQMDKFKQARIYGYGASAFGRFDGADAITEGLIGPVLTARTFQEAVKEGAICPIKVFMVKVRFDLFPIWDRNEAYRKLVFYNPNIIETVAELSDNIIPPEWQTIVFVAQEKQSEEVVKAMQRDCDIAIASKMTPKERRARFEAMRKGQIKRCAATSIYSTGVTFPDLRAVINVAGGGGSITGTQRPGRLAQNRPGKVAGYLIDFLFECKQDEPDKSEVGMYQEQSEPQGASYCRQVARDSQSRLDTYRRLGYEIKIVDEISAIKEELK